MSNGEQIDPVAMAAVYWTNVDPLVNLFELRSILACNAFEMLCFSKKMSRYR